MSDMEHARIAPAVSRADIEKVVEAVFDREAGYGLRGDRPWPGTEPVSSAVWDYLKGTDQAVYVVRESDIAAVEVRRNPEGDWWTKNRGCGEGSTADGMRQMVGICIRDAIEYEAIARAIEAEQAADPVEALADDFAQALAGDENIGGSWSMDPAAWRDIARALARRAHDVLGQEIKK